MTGLSKRVKCKVSLNYEWLFSCWCVVLVYFDYSCFIGVDC